MLEAFFWWLTFLLLGLAVLPITIALFRNLPDRGYGFSRPLGLLLFGYGFWILVTFNALPNSRATTIDVFLIVLAISAAVVFRTRTKLLAYLKEQWRVVLATEILFASVFVVWGILRSYSPDIAHTEQPMDFALLNGILASETFPPNDPWFAGESISYYYFGYLMSAGVTQLTGFDSSITYNLTLMSLAAMTATAVFSLGYNLTRTMRGPGGASWGLGTAVAAGLVAVVLVLFMGNLVGALEFLQANDLGSKGLWNWLSVNGLEGVSRSSSWYPDEFGWWFRDTRVVNTFVEGRGVDFTINEFPYFSFLLGDLHPHLMSLPFVGLAIGLSLNMVRSSAVPGLAWARAHVWELLLIIVALGSLGFLNSWDLPTFAGLFLAAMLMRAFHARAEGSRVSFREVGLLMAVIVAGAAVLYLPFYLYFESQASDAIGVPVLLPVRREMTRPIHLFLALGPLLVLSLGLLAALAWDGFRQPFLRLLRRQSVAETANGASPGARRSRWLRSPVFWAIALPLIPFVVWALAQVGFTLSGRDDEVWGYRLAAGAAGISIGSRFWHVLPLLVVITLGLGLIFRYARRQGQESAPMQFVLLLMVFGFFLILGAELFHIPDVFTKSAPRMNTVFKLHYQAWLLLSLAGAVSIVYWWTKTTRALPSDRWPNASMLIVFGIVLAAGFLYVPAAAFSKSDNFNPSPTLDGLASLRRLSPGEYEAADWLRGLGEDDVIVEALPLDGSGRPTGDYNPQIGRISQRTGLPTVLAWPGHEDQWGRDDTEIVQRAPRCRPHLSQRRHRSRSRDLGQVRRTLCHRGRSRAPDLRA